MTSYTELRREALSADREARLTGETAKTPWITECLGAESGPPIVAASDYMKALPDGIRAWVPGRFEVLGTDGFGRSDFRAELRDFFEVDHRHIAVAALPLTGRNRRARAIRRKRGHREVRDRHRPPRPGPPVSQVKVPDIGDFTDVPVIESPGRGRRRSRGRAGPDHPRVRQGDDGGAGPARRSDRRASGRRRRRGQRGNASRGDLGRGWWRG